MDIFPRLEQEMDFHDVCFQMALDVGLNEVTAYHEAASATAVFSERYTGNLKKDTKIAVKLVEQFRKYLDQY